VAEDQDPATDQPQGTRAIKDRNQRIREEAAEKRKARRESEQRRQNVQRNLDAGEMVDDALARGTHAAQNWLKRHMNVLQWVIVASAAGGIGWQIYTARHHKTLAKATDTLLAGITADFARVGEEEDVEADPQTGLGDPRPHYADDGARLKAAEAAYRSVTGNDNLKTLAQLALAGALFDEAKHKDALAAYQAVRGSALAQKDTDVRARAIEGVGLSQEGLGDKEAARKAFHELSNTDAPLLSALGLYHEGRLAYAAGERDKAKELLKQALEKAGKADGADAQPGFVSQASRELLGAIDPSAVPAPPEKGGLTPEQLQALAKQAAGEAGGDKNGTPGLSKEKLDALLRQLKQQAPPAPSGAPAGKP
jgi:tetratricopeptide (TPR) repeat protein